MFPTPAFFAVFRICRGDDKSLARPGRKQARRHARDARDFIKIETRAVIKFFFFLQGKAPKEIRAILTEILACFLHGRAKDLSAPFYLSNFSYLLLKYQWPELSFIAPTYNNNNNNNNNNNIY